MKVSNSALRASVEKVEITKCVIACNLDFCETSSKFDFGWEQNFKNMHFRNYETDQKL